MTLLQTITLVVVTLLALFLSILVNTNEGYSRKKATILTIWNVIQLDLMTLGIFYLLEHFRFTFTFI